MSKDSVLPVAICQGQISMPKDSPSVDDINPRVPSEGSIRVPLRVPLKGSIRVPLRAPSRDL